MSSLLTDDTSIDSRAVGCRALEWIESQLATLEAVPRGRLPLEPLRTVIAEHGLFTVFCAPIWKKKGTNTFERRIAELGGIALNLQELLRESYFPLTLYLVMWYGLNRNGSQWGIPHSELVLLVRQSNYCALPRPLFQIIEAKYLLEKLQIDNSLPSVLELAELTRRVRAAGATTRLEKSQISELTHFIYYCSDFGRESFCFSTNDEKELSTEIAASLAWACSQRNFDLVAELGFAQWCLHRVVNQETTSKAMEFLAQAQKPDGSFGLAAADDLDPIKRYLKNYHAVMTTFMLCAGINGDWARVQIH